MEHGIDVFTGYGMSETCPILTLAQLQPHMLDWPADRQAEIRCKTGRPVPFVQIRIVDTDMNDVPDDGVSPGEIVVRAPWLTAGYLKDPGNSETLWAGGWLHTGDIAVRIPDGYLRITDRLKDVIKTGGEWVSSLDIEDLIMRHPSGRGSRRGRRARPEMERAAAGFRGAQARTVRQRRRDPRPPGRVCGPRPASRATPFPNRCGLPTSCRRPASAS